MVEPPHTESYRGFVFVNFDRGAMPLGEYLAGAKEYIDLIVEQSPTGRMEVIRGVFPFILLLLLVLGIITYVPILSLWLPHLVYGS